LPYYGSITIDSWDIDNGNLPATELSDLLKHEMAHVLGFGTIWQDLNLLTGTRGSDPRFTGAKASAEYRALFGVSDRSVPVEATGGSGTALSHWRETTFGHELMTGWDDAGFNPMSRVTVASMADIGYTVNMAAADPFTPPRASSLAGSGFSQTFIVSGGVQNSVNTEQFDASRRPRASVDSLPAFSRGETSIADRRIASLQSEHRDSTVETRSVRPTESQSLSVGDLHLVDSAFRLDLRWLDA
jgi:hypothetical protein